MYLNATLIEVLFHLLVHGQPSVAEWHPSPRDGFSEMNHTLEISEIRGRGPTAVTIVFRDQGRMLGLIVLKQS